MVVVHDLRKPLDEKLAIDVGGFLHIGHVEIAVVIVADVFLPKARDVLKRALGGLGLAHIPVGNQLHAVRVGMGGQNDNVVQDAHGFRIVARYHFVDELHQLMSAQYFAGVQSAIDPHHGLAFVRQCARLIVGESFGEREPAGDFFVAGQVLLILGRSEDDHPFRAAFFTFSDLDQLHTVGFGSQLLPPRG